MGPTVTTGTTASSANPISISESRIKIEGAQYRATDTADGYFIVHDVPVFGAVAKGVKGAPEDIGREWMVAEVARAQKQYRDSKYTGPVHKGHNKELELTEPEFLGYFLLKHVGTQKINAKDEPVIFADLKLKRSAFDRALNGELPYISPELTWAENRITSLSFLDSKPPHFQFAIFTIGEVRKDPTARFEAVLYPTAHFAQHETKTAGCCEHCAQYGAALSTMAKKMGVSFGGPSMADAPASEKPATNLPIEPKALESPKEEKKPAIRMEDDPRLAAQFAAYEGRIAALESDKRSREDEARVSGLVEKAMQDLAGYPKADTLREKIAKFARMGEDALKSFVATYKDVAPKDPPKSASSFEGQTVQVNDPLLAKFQKDGPDKVEQAMKYLGQYREMKAALRGYSLTPEQHIDMCFRTKGGN